MIYIIGSGPAGIACASALLKRGCYVTMLDVGVVIDDYPAPELSSPLNFSDSKKLSLGSDYVYQEVAQHFLIKADKHVGCLASFSKGGFSNVWGAFVGVYHQDDIADWPIGIEQLNKYYPEIMLILNIAKDESQNSTSNTFSLSSQGKSLFNHLQKNRKKLYDLGFEYSTASLAVKFKDKSKQHCDYCGSCLRGCPKDLIYSSRHSLNELIVHPRFAYINHVVVTKVNENLNELSIEAYHRSSRGKLNYSASQVFLACGPIITTQLMLSSKKIYHQPVSFMDSNHFRIPVLLFKGSSDVQKERLMTLCQLTLSLNQPYISEKKVFLQIYTYMDYYSEFIEAKLGIFKKIISPLLTPFFNRLIIIQGFLHSSDSHRVTMLSKSKNEICLTSQLNPRVKVIVNKIIMYLTKNCLVLSFIPLKLLSTISKVGKSFHYGGSIPMKKNPASNEADTLGRAYGFKKVHIVDATIFPSIPAGPITTTIMANAYRIATECEIYE
jgi:choline dehydrogenase-like flavoprotein